MSGSCEKKIIYVGVSTDEDKNVLDRLIEHFCAMSALNKNIIERVCEKAHENIYCYMNPYLWHEDVEVVLIVDVEELEHELEGKILKVKDVVDNIEKTISKYGLEKTKNFEDNLKKSKNGDLEALERILINITQPHLNKKNKKDETLKDLESHLKSYLCNYGLDIEGLINLRDDLKRLKLEKLKGCYIIKHSILPEELTCCIRTIRTMLFRKNTSKLFRKFCCNK